VLLTGSRLKISNGFSIRIFAVRKVYFFSAFALVALVCATSAQASFVFPVNNTGREFGLGDNDTNWKVAFSGATSVPTTDPSLTFADSFVANPRPATWVANSDDSKWVSPTVNQTLAPGNGNLPGFYYYKTTFNLGALAPSTANFTFRWATDNSARLFLNGHDFSPPFTTPNSGFSNFSSVQTVNSNFVSGVNTLVIRVRNITNQISPTGLRFEFLSTSAVPEPASAALFMIGLPAIGMVFRGRRS